MMKPSMAEAGGKSAAGLSPWAWAGLALAVGLPWFLLIRHLWVEWAASIHYGYGKFVPVLIAALLWQRWPGRPAVIARSRRGTALAYLGALAGWLIIAAMLPIQEANPEWRLTSWIMATGVVSVSWAALYCCGGWSWLRHFGFCAAVIFVAVPWPRAQETALILGLMQANVVAIVEMMAWMGIAAVQQGNTVIVNGIPLGVEEACSGVRSLQSSIMVAVVLGEFYRFGWTGRLLLLIAGVAAALMGNLIRSAWLVLVTNAEGYGAVDRWHDPAGYSVLAGVFLCLWGVAALAYHRQAHPATGPPPDADPPRVVQPMRIGFSVLALVILLGSLAATEAWYRMTERDLAALPRWKVDFSAIDAEIKREEVPSIARTILRFDFGEQVAWRDGEGNQWLAFQMRWLPRRNSIAEVAGHDPRDCMGGTGFELVRGPEWFFHRTPNGDLPFRHFVFEKAGNQFQVFQCVMEDHIHPAASRAGDEDTRSYSSRMEAVRLGRRNLGQRMVQFVVTGQRDDNQAALLVNEVLSRTLRWDEVSQ